MVSKREEAEAEYALGLDFVGQGELEKAQKAFERALNLCPDHLDALYSLARVFDDRDELEEAAAAFRRVIELNPLFGQGHGELGQVLAKLGRFDEASRSLKKCLELRPDDPIAITSLAATLRRRGETREARGLFEKAIRLAPSMAEAYQGLTEILVDADGDLAASESLLQAAAKAVVDVPKLGLIELSLGHLMVMQGRLEDGIHWFDKSARTDPTNYDAKVSLAHALTEGHRYTEALELLELLDSALQEQPRLAELFACLGSVLEKLGRHAEAVSAFQSATSLDPQCLETDGPDWSASYSRALRACEESR